MSQDVLERVKANSMYPDELMEEISKSNMTTNLLWSTVIHAVVIVITSIGFINLAMRYDSWNPQVVFERQQAAQVEAAEAEAEAEAEAQSSQQGTDGSTANGAAADDGLSPIERELQETDFTVPSGSNVGFDEPDSLDE